MPVISPSAPYVLLENSLDLGADAQSYLFRKARRIIVCETGETLGAALDALDAAISEGFHAAGWIAYEAGYWLEDRLQPLRHIRSPGQPLLWFGIFDAPEILTPPELEAFWRGRNEGSQDFSVSDVRLALSPGAYEAHIRRILDYLAAGDIYQANFTMPCRFTFDGNIEAFHRMLRESQRVPYGAVLAMGETTILSYSPELFLQKRGSRLRARPMKGTAARGMTAEDDAARRQWLRQDTKSRAELLMIVDLLRNDVGRLAEIGSVGVSSAYAVEAYRSVLQMTTTVEATVPPDLSIAHLVKSLFPCGSVTGAPKIRAMQIIADEEEGPRGVYTGAIGMIRPNRDFTFSVPIRTLRIDNGCTDSGGRIAGPGRGVLGIGSGIVADSDPAEEYRECLLKADFFSRPQPAFALIETMRAQDGAVPLLDLHIERLAASARYFAYPFDAPAVRADIAALLAAEAKAGLWRLRLLLSRSGDRALSATPYADPSPGEDLKVGLAETPTDSADPLLYHKTTARPLYAAALATARDKGLYDLLFVNRRGEMSEAARSTIIIENHGRLLTPPLTSGLLPGVYRRHLIDSGRLGESVITPQALMAADRLYLCNALIGLRPARLVA